MIKAQEKIIHYLQDVKTSLKPTGIEAVDCDALIEASTEQELLIPVIGEFSAGKSSLLNNYLGRNILPTAILPETALATELRYATKESVIAITADGREDEYSLTDFETIKARASEYHYLKAYINNDNLKKIEPLILVDMPGFNAPVELHNKAIMLYLARGAHYILLTSVESGTITRSMTSCLEDIRNYERDFSIFVSKANLRSVDEVNKIARHIEELLALRFGAEKKATAIGKDGGAALAQIVASIKPDELIERIFFPQLKEQHYSIESSLNTKIAAFQKDKNKNAEVVSELKETQTKLLAKKEKMLGTISDNYSDSSARRVVDAVASDLISAQDELAQIILGGNTSALSSRVGEIVRSSLISNVKSSMQDIAERITKDFRVEMRGLDTVLKNYTGDTSWENKVAGVAKGFLSAVPDLLSKASSKLEGKTNTIYKAISTVLAITTTVVSPLVELVIVFLPEIIKGFISLLGGANEEANKLAQARSHVASKIIPDVRQKLAAQLPSIFAERVSEMIAQTSEQYDKLLAEKQAEIAAAEAEKLARKNEVEAQIAILSKARDEINAASAFLYN